MAKTASRRAAIAAAAKAQAEAEIAKAHSEADATSQAEAATAKAVEAAAAKAQSDDAAKAKTFAATAKAEEVIEAMPQYPPQGKEAMPHRPCRNVLLCLLLLAGSTIRGFEAAIARDQSGTGVADLSFSMPADTTNYNAVHVGAKSIVSSDTVKADTISACGQGVAIRIGTCDKGHANSDEWQLDVGSANRDAAINAREKGLGKQAFRVMGLMFSDTVKADTISACGQGVATRNGTCDKSQANSDEWQLDVGGANRDAAIIARKKVQELQAFLIIGQAISACRKGQVGQPASVTGHAIIACEKGQEWQLDVGSANRQADISARGKEQEFPAFRVIGQAISACGNGQEEKATPVIGHATIACETRQEWQLDAGGTSICAAIIACEKGQEWQAAAVIGLATNACGKGQEWQAAPVIGQATIACEKRQAWPPEVRGANREAAISAREKGQEFQASRVMGQSISACEKGQEWQAAAVIGQGTNAGGKSFKPLVSLAKQSVHEVEDKRVRPPQALGRQSVRAISDRSGYQTLAGPAGMRQFVPATTDKS